jgi:hypothetical protein
MPWWFLGVRIKIGRLARYREDVTIMIIGRSDRIMSANVASWNKNF